MTEGFIRTIMYAAARECRVYFGACAIVCAAFAGAIIAILVLQYRTLGIVTRIAR